GHVQVAKISLNESRSPESGSTHSMLAVRMESGTNSGSFNTRHPPLAASAIGSGARRGGMPRHFARVERQGNQWFTVARAPAIHLPLRAQSLHQRMFRRVPLHGAFAAMVLPRKVDQRPGTPNQAVVRTPDREIETRAFDHARNGQCKDK